MKFLINLLFWYLIAQIAVLLHLICNSNGRSLFFLRTLLVLALLLSVISTPLARLSLKASLTFAQKTSTTSAPAFIFVLEGGYTPGLVPDEDILVYESQRRVMHGVFVWRRNPDARIVFSGADYEYDGIRGSDRLVQLMAETARNQGVPATDVLLESDSVYSRQHPVEALKLPGVTATTHVAVLKSSWHMRRAQREFYLHFEQEQTYPVPKVWLPLAWQDFLPDADTLDANTTLLHEWVGMLWYTFHDLEEQVMKC